MTSVTINEQSTVDATIHEQAIVDAVIDSQNQVVSASVSQVFDVNATVVGETVIDATIDASTTTVDASVQDQVTIDVTLDDSQNVVDASVNEQAVVEAEVVGPTVNASAKNLSGGDAGIYSTSSTGVLLLRTLKSLSSLLTIVENGNTVDFDLNIQSEIQKLELRLLCKGEQSNQYTELTFDGNGNPINVDVWTDSGKDTKLFSQVLVFTGDDLSSSTTTDETTGAVLTSNFTVDGDGNITSYDEVLS